MRHLRTQLKPLHSGLRLILILASLLDSTKTASTSGTDETNLTSSRTIFRDSRRHTNVLVVTSSVGMLHRILRDTTNFRPAIALHRVFVVSSSSLEKGLVGTSSSSYNSNLSTDCRWDCLFASRRKAETSGSLVLIVCDHNREGTTGACKRTTVAKLGFYIANNRSLGHAVQRQDVPNSQGSLLPAVDELTGVHAFRAQKEFGVSFIAVGIQELDFRNRSSTTRVVDNVLNDTPNVSMLLSIVQWTEFHGTLACSYMGLENGGFTLTLRLSSQRKE